MQIINPQMNQNYILSYLNNYHYSYHYLCMIGTKQKNLLGGGSVCCKKQEQFQTGVVQREPFKLFGENSPNKTQNSEQQLEYYQKTMIQNGQKNFIDIAQFDAKRKGANIELEERNTVASFVERNPQTIIAKILIQENKSYKIMIKLIDSSKT